MKSNSKIKQQISALNKKYKDKWGKISKIAKKLGIKKSMVYYYLSSIEEKKSRSEYQKNYRNSKDFLIKSKLYNFTGKDNKISLEDFLDKFKDKAYCYLTGTPIDLFDTGSYHLDHIIPRCSGGENTLDNMGLLIPSVNTAKGGLNKEEFLELCKKVLSHNSNT